eukprot:TRINITY_DN3350_c0_g1_i1.p1 TRINITY_DN3350_c0_g1~~TRINITY_DN3350_c0_g1_i1.p1  ORF type:complete len:223 (-),score=29.33 TRINITY_DN3350_c0_g1_i1:170-838(-)
MNPMKATKLLLLGCEIIAENMLVMKNPIALCIYGGLQNKFYVYLFGLREGKLCSLWTEFLKPEEFFQFREMDLFEFLELILKRIDEYDTHPYSQLELEEISKKRVSFFLEHPIHSSFAHASMQKGQQWCKVFPIGFPSRGSLANELIGSKEAKGYELYFNQEICAVEVRREIINGIDGYFFLRKLINKMEVRECRELFHKYGHKFGVAIACKFFYSNNVFFK